MHPFRKKVLFSFLLAIICCLSSLQKVQASVKPPKWGKITKAEADLKKVSYDPEAHAVVLFNYGHLTFLNGKFLVKKHVRIKILDQEGVSEGDIILPYYSKNKLENIDQVKAHTIEFTENGKIIKHSVDKKQVYDVQEDENWSEVRFTLPAVKPGCIIEYSYNLYSENFTFLEGWVFQQDIPTLKSTFKAEVPLYLRYNVLMHGSRMLRKYQNSKPVNEWSLENLPALKPESFTYNLSDYAEKISFQLTSYDKRGLHGSTTEEKVFTDWNNISKDLLSNPGFRSFLNSNRALEDILTLFPAEKDSLLMAKKLYAHIRDNYTWNRRYGLLPDLQLKEILAGKNGNGTAINLLLTGLLQRAGFDAHPAYISTKNHGRVSPDFPFLSQFNHVISIVQIQGKEYLLDASEPRLAFGILPVVDLNQKALALSKEGARWVNITDQSGSSTIISYFADLAGGRHRFNCSWSGFEALHMASILSRQNGEQIIVPADPLLHQDSVNIENAISENNTLKASLFFSGETNMKAEKIYYSLPVFGIPEENPLNNDVRHLPVDFGYTSSKILVYNIVLPEGYTIEEKPENLSIGTPGGEAVFLYRTQQQGNTLTIQVKLDTRSSLIPVSSYLHLRELYSKMISHCQKPYVFSKI